MAKNYTCDKCGYPMEPATPLQIQHKTYDICTACHNEIMKGLDGKGEYSSQQAPKFGTGVDPEQLRKLYGKFKNPEDYLEKPPVDQ